MAQKYGPTHEQSTANRQAIHDRAAAVGFTMATDENSRIYNTFDAHRLLHWAGLAGDQKVLKRALFDAYSRTTRTRPTTRSWFARRLRRAWIRTRPMRFWPQASTPRRSATLKRAWQAARISSVPAVVINDRYLISGGQPTEYFEQALRQIAAEA